MAAADALRRFGVTVRENRRLNAALVVAVIAFAIVLPQLYPPGSGFTDDAVTALAYVVMALGLNIVVGYAGLLDLGYVAFFAIGAYCVGWFGSDFFYNAHVHVLVSAQARALTGVHLNFVLVIVAAILLTALAGAIIGLPTLRLRGDYIAIVTLAFGQIIGVFAVNGDTIHVFGGTLTAGLQGITPVDPVYFPGIGSFDQLHLRPWYWTIFVIVLLVLFVNLRLRDSRLGRAWIALREDEVAAVSMGIPLVRTKLLAYAAGAAFGGVAGVFLGAYLNQINADQFQFSFSIFVLAMIIVGGLGSVWGALLGALLLSYINYYLIPDVLNGLPSALGLSFNLTDLSFGIFGFLLVFVMVLRPQGLFPERRRALELTEAAVTAEGSAGPEAPA
ncbi:MAG: branched-chain amino acid ABC transporter permease [Solirubrobacteraceae bacterium]